MRKLEDGSIQIDSAYEASKLAVANGFNREADEHKYGLSLTDKPTLAISNEATFFNRSLTNFALTSEAMRDKLRFRSDPNPPEDTWMSKSWTPPESWADSGLTPPGTWEEQAIIVGPERAKVIETVLSGIVRGVNFKQLRINPGLEDFRPDLAATAKVSEKLNIGSGEAEFLLGVLNGNADLLSIEGIDIRRAA